MINTICINMENQIETNVLLERLDSTNYKWYWIDFNHPTEEEIQFLINPLQFHPLAIEDCTHTLQRPKLDYYHDHTFFVTHSINPIGLKKEELNFFVGDDYIVTFHQQHSIEVQKIWQQLLQSNHLASWDQYVILYRIMDSLVDNYFPIVYGIEDKLNELEDNSSNKSMETLLDELFTTRHDLLSLRHTVTPMRDLLYRMLSSHRLKNIQDKVEYFSDIYDHLLKLSELIDANREITADIRDSYISYNSHQTNRIMKVLTVITTLFMPLTFIAGIYGMNFVHMPELSWHYGYFATLLLMFIIGFGMFLWFKKKGWFK